MRTGGDLLCTPALGLGRGREALVALAAPYPGRRVGLVARRAGAAPAEVPRARARMATEHALREDRRGDTAPRYPRGREVRNSRATPKYLQLHF
jgi:hypothetical protein